MCGLHRPRGVVRVDKWAGCCPGDVAGHGLTSVFQVPIQNLQDATYADSGSQHLRAGRRVRVRARAVQERAGPWQEKENNKRVESARDLLRT